MRRLPRAHQNTYVDWRRFDGRAQTQFRSLRSGESPRRLLWPRFCTSLMCLQMALAPAGGRSCRGGVLPLRTDVRLKPMGARPAPDRHRAQRAIACAQDRSDIEKMFKRLIWGAVVRRLASEGVRAQLVENKLLLPERPDQPDRPEPGWLPCRSRGNAVQQRRHFPGPDHCRNHRSQAARRRLTLAS